MTQSTDAPRKQCRCCGEWKVASKKYFHKQADGLYGFRSTCKACRAAGAEPDEKRLPPKQPFIAVGGSIFGLWIGSYSDGYRPLLCTAIPKGDDNRGTKKRKLARAVLSNLDLASYLSNPRQTIEYAAAQAQSALGGEYLIHYHNL